jgi:hypothetical protein
MRRLMHRARAIIVGLLALWLVIGPVAVVSASAVAGTPCASMTSTPADDGCCDTAAMSCAVVCGASAAIILARPHVSKTEPSVAPITSAIAGYASQAAPPDVAPPKNPVS